MPDSEAIAADLDRDQLSSSVLHGVTLMEEDIMQKQEGEKPPNKDREEQRNQAAKTPRRAQKAKRGDTRSVMATEGVLSPEEEDLADLVGDECGQVHFGIEHEKKSMTTSTEVTKTRRPWARRAKAQRKEQGSDGTQKECVDEELLDEEDESVDLNGNVSIQGEGPVKERDSSLPEQKTEPNHVAEGLVEEDGDTHAYAKKDREEPLGYPPAAEFKESVASVGERGTLQLRCHVAGLDVWYQFGCTSAMPLAV